MHASFVERRAVVGKKRTPLVWRAGAGDAWNATSVFYARLDGVDATFAIAQSRVRALLEACEARSAHERLVRELVAELEGRGETRDAHHRTQAQAGCPVQ